MDPFVEQLKECCKHFPTRSKWVCVPTHAIGRTLGERLVLEGTNWLNLRFVTPLDIALRMGAPFLVERGIDPSEEELGPALMMRLLMELPEAGGYFRPLAGHPTLAQALWTTVRELRMAGVRSSDLKPEAFASSAKRAELVALLGRYEAFLAQHHRADMATVYEEALAHPDWCPVQPADCWTELPDANWNPLQRRLLDALPGEKLLPRAFALQGIDVPRRLANRPTERVAPEQASNPLAFLLAPAPAPQSTRVELFHAGGREAEIEEVFRRILAAGVPLDQVEVACSSEAHVALVWEKALRHNWPVTLGAGIPATFTRPGRALLGLCDWVETDFAAGHFRRLLQSGDISVEEGKGFTAGQAARVLTRAEAGWGRNTYSLSLTRLIKAYEARAADADVSDEDRAYAKERAEQASRVRDWIVSLVDSIPVPRGNEAVSLQAVVDAVLDVLEHRVARSNALDHRCASALIEYVRDLRALGAFSCGLPEALRFIRERVESLTVAPERPRPGHLFACALSQSGYAGRPHLFVVGLEEGRVFSSATEDPILLDDERGGITDSLKRSADRIDEAVYGVVSRLAVSGAHVTFSYSCRDTREFRETFASWLMLQAYRLQQGNGALSYQAMTKALGEPKSAVPQERELALSGAAWWLRSVAGTADAGVAAVEQTFAGVASGRAADQRRQSADFTEFDGFVPAAGPALDPASETKVYSVTELESAAGCPFKFFLKRGLGLRPVDERERDRDVWLDPLTRGSELHDVYAALLRRTRNEQRRPVEEDAVWLLAYAQQRLDTLNREMPAPTPEILERETADFLADVELFLEAEVKESTRTPIGLEVTFGRPLGDDEDPMATPEPVSISLAPGLTLRLAGRIDRVNQVGEATFEVLDYKTGGYWRDDWKGVFNGGRRLQHALYGLAIRELVKATHKTPTIRGGVYYFSSHKGRQQSVSISAPSLASIAAVLSDLREVITSGHFTRTTNERNCTYCDFHVVCGSAANTQAESKLSDPNAAAFLRLTAHV